MHPDIRYFISWTLLRIVLFNIIIGGSGIFLIAYELFSDRLRLRTADFDKIAVYLGAFVTLLGVIATAASIYTRPRKATLPSPESYVVAPIVIGACCIALYVLVTRGELPPNIINGFALLGLAGALFRIQPNPQRAATSIESAD